MIAVAENGRVAGMLLKNGRVAAMLLKNGRVAAYAVAGADPDLKRFRRKAPWLTHICLSARARAPKTSSSAV
jgi:hypothetical protein